MKILIYIMNEMKPYIWLTSIAVTIALWFYIWGKVLDVMHHKEKYHVDNCWLELAIFIGSTAWVAGNIFGVMLLFVWSWT